MGKIYRCTLHVRGYELDSYGHVNHAVYVNYLEHARWRLLEDEGVTIGKFKEWKCSPVIASIEVKYLKPAFIGDPLEIETVVTGHRRVAFTLEQKILRGTTPIVTAKVCAVIVNEAGRPTELPAHLLNLWRTS